MKDNDQFNQNKTSSANAVDLENSEGESAFSPPSFSITAAPPVPLQRQVNDQAGNSEKSQEQSESKLPAPKERFFLPPSENDSKTQLKENKTGMPDNLKSGIESLSSMSMDDVTVNYNSSKPAQFQAHAYAQGTNIEIGPGQEKHLPHEAWHVVQQKQGRVSPTTTMGKTYINDDSALEKEADVMGAKALQGRFKGSEGFKIASRSTSAFQLKQDLMQFSLREDMHGSWERACDEIDSVVDGTSGVVSRQIQAVQDFTNAIGVEDPPSLTQEVVILGLNIGLTAALGGIGSQLTRIAGGLVGGTAIVKPVIDGIVGAGKAKVSAAVSAAVTQVAGEQPTPRGQFCAAQSIALRAIAREQVHSLHGALARVENTAGSEDDWALANDLYSTYNSALDSAYEIQYNKMIDTWFNMQVSAVGPGARAGVFNINLDSKYPNENQVIEDGNIVGVGDNESIRRRLAARPLNEITLPKIINMNGSLGHGIMDCRFYLKVEGVSPQADGPEIRNPGRNHVDENMNNSHRLTDVFVYGGGYGREWLVAYKFGLDDIESDDPRVTNQNMNEGAYKLWNDLKSKTCGSVDNSEW